MMKPLSAPTAVLRAAASRLVIGRRRRALSRLYSAPLLGAHLRADLVREAELSAGRPRVHGPEAQESGASGIISLDIFDTLITRCWHCPTDLFFEVGRRLIEHRLGVENAESWAEQRVAVEASLRQAPVEEITLNEIYAALGRRMGWNDEQSAQVRELELACELEAVRPVAANVDFYHRLREAGARVVLVSDTYFDKPSIMRMLVACGIAIEPERVYLSSEASASKRTGRLFEHVKSQLRLITPIKHVGDNLDSDIYAAAAAGAEPIYFAASRPTRYEGSIYSVRGYPLAMRSALAGTARALRLQCRHTDEHLRVVWDTAANVAGPLLFGFVLWLLHAAKRRGISRLYFVSRDGQILLPIAKAIVAKMGWPIECRYLYGSRQAWHLPALRAFDTQSLNWILSDHCLTTLRDHLAKVELNPAACRAVLARHGFSAGSWDEVISDDRRDALQRLFCDPQLKEMILERAAACRAVASEYLRAEGVLDDRAIGIVDIGWHGRLQSSLAQLVSDAAPGNRRKLTGFYLGLLKRPGSGAGELLSFLDDADPPLPPRLINPTLLEVFCAADHGSVRGYERIEERIEPVLYAPTNDLALQWGLDVQQQAIVDFAAAMIDAVAASGVDVERWVSCLRAAAVCSLRQFTRAPSPAEADVFGSFRHATHQTHTRAVELAPRLPVRSKWLAAAIPGAVRYDGFWLEGSMRRSGARSIAESAPFRLFSFRRGLLGGWLAARRLMRSPG